MRGGATAGFPGPLATELAAFRAQNPSYDGRSELEQLRAQEYGRLDAAGHVYLDWAGAGICSESQRQHHRDSVRHPLPAGPVFERTCARVLAHFNAAPEQYAVVFTPSASSALTWWPGAFPSLGVRTCCSRRTTTRRSIRSATPRGPAAP